MKNIFTFILLFATISVFSQTSMTVHTNSGATNYLLSDIDSITYSGGNGGGTGAYNLGDAGPSGGIVIYDKGAFTNGWRYLEISSTNLNAAEWGCAGTNVTGTSDAIGSGEANTNTIVNQCTTPGTAAKICYNYSVTNNGVVYDDWFLPSIEELNLAYVAVTQNGVTITDFDFFNFLSSTQYDINTAWYLEGSNGSYENDAYKGSTNYQIRAYRAF